MAQEGLLEVDLKENREPDPPRNVFGSINITFYEDDGNVTPVVTFMPLGRINPNTLERCLPFIYREIQRQQVKDRRRSEANGG